MDVGSFSPGQEALSKSPAAAHGLVGRSPASAEEGGLLFGDFLLATQEKATRAPQAHESSRLDGVLVFKKTWPGLRFAVRVATWNVTQNC